MAVLRVILPCGVPTGIQRTEIWRVIEALDHIKSLGVNAIWLTPVLTASTATGGEKLQATGYFTNDYFKIDPHFGSDAEFRRFVDEAHARGLYVILDGVFGHHGGVTAPSPSGHVLDSTVTACDRADGGTATSVIRLRWNI